MKYSIVTFGCRVNQADSLRMEEEFRARGAVAAAAADADVVCRQHLLGDGDRGPGRAAGDQTYRARQTLVTHRRHGCYATRCEADVSALPNVVRVVRNSEKDALVARVVDGDGPCGAAIEPGVAGRTAFTLRVQTGCEERCAYCIIPSTRGAGRSLPIADVVREVTRISAAGFKEIALTGVHLGSYGRDLPPPRSLIDLLRALERVEAELFPHHSSNPWTARGSRDLVASTEDGSRSISICRQHASVGCSRDGRPYTLGINGCVEAIHASLPHASPGRT